MDPYHGISSAQFYQPSPWSGHEDEPWVGMPPTPQTLPIRNAIVPLQRYIQEPDQPWYTPRSFEDPSLDLTYASGFPNPSSCWIQEPSQYPHFAAPRYTSPSLSGLSPPSTYHSLSDRRSISWSPPSTPHYSPELVHRDSLGLPSGGASGVKREQPCVEEPYVALNDIQTYADTFPDEDTFEGDASSPYYTLNVQEGYQPMAVDRGQPNGHFAHEDRATHRTTEPRPDAPRFRRRQAPDSRPMASSTTSKVTKRTTGRKRTATKPEADNSESQDNVSSNRAFPCPFALYGCRSSFGSKNEWKRHINTQHMRLTFWRCDLCDHNSRKPNDFNRKDLFIQHVRRMHPPLKTPGACGKPPKTKSGLNTRPSKHDPYEQELNAIALRCFQNTRPSPELSGCLFCEEKFTGRGSWDERLEHIGRHMELAKKASEGLELSPSPCAVPLDPRYWLPDQELEEWLEDEEIIVDDGTAYVLAEDAQA